MDGHGRIRHAGRTLPAGYAFRWTKPDLLGVCFSRRKRVFGAAMRENWVRLVKFLHAAEVNGECEKTNAECEMTRSKDMVGRSKATIRGVLLASAKKQKDATWSFAVTSQGGRCDGG